MNKNTDNNPTPPRYLAMLQHHAANPGDTESVWNLIRELETEGEYKDRMIARLREKLNSALKAYSESLTQSKAIACGRIAAIQDLYDDTETVSTEDLETFFEGLKSLLA